MTLRMNAKVEILKAELIFEGVAVQNKRIRE